MTQHDTAAIRRLANRIDSMASTLSSTGKNASRQIDSINHEMVGDTVKAIDTTVDRLDEEIQAIRGGLARCAETLYRYARELDAADEKAKAMISSK